jgi:DNA-binding XRE family transcriptional regulator
MSMPLDRTIRWRWAGRIKAARLTLGLDQAALADMLDVGQQTVSSWETGRQAPKPSIWLNLAEVLGVEWYDLFDPAVRDGDDE